MRFYHFYRYGQARDVYAEYKPEGWILVMGQTRLIHGHYPTPEAAIAAALSACPPEFDARFEAR